jgi:hypothetical protein
MKLAQSLNRTVLVAIPAFFGDGQTRACKLVDIETAGLWLACDELHDRLGPAHEISVAWTGPVIAFFPFCQILYLVDPSQFAELVNPQRPTPAPIAQAPPKNTTDEAYPKGQSKPKDPKRRR